MDALGQTEITMGQILKAADAVPPSQIGAHLIQELRRLDSGLRTQSCRDQAIAGVMLAVLSNRFLTETLDLTIDAETVIPS